MKIFTKNEILLIYKAISEYEYNHYMTMDEKRQKTINELLTYFTKLKNRKFC